MRENTAATENDGGEEKFAPTTPTSHDLGQQQDRGWTHKGIQVPYFGGEEVSTDRDGTAVFPRGGGAEKGSTDSPDNEPTESSISGDGGKSDSDLPEILELPPVCERGSPQRGMNLLGSMDGSSRGTAIRHTSMPHHTCGGN
ncbi:unnamed protein product [Ectocarpus sp. CCAP 1310/34]|nr:unnamed protein product [Ectocarpus sp. CCAP 1310/34]